MATISQGGLRKYYYAIMIIEASFTNIATYMVMLAGNLKRKC
jgi:hypothetical protein